MQFLYPQVLWALLLLLIPVIVHLFQLRRFKTTLFTNVALLQKLTTETNKSKSIKRWLLLFSRLLAMTALVLAFARPFIQKNQTAEQTTGPLFIYLDNSLSMQALSQGVPLLEEAVQLLIKRLPDQQMVEVLTNDRSLGPDQWGNLKSKLPGLNFTAKKRSLNEVRLRATRRSSSGQSHYQRALLLSDFQEGDHSFAIEQQDSVFVYTVPLRPEEQLNAWIDSLSLSTAPNSSMQLNIWIGGGQEGENIPVSVQEEERLLAKTTLDAPGKGKVERIQISLPDQQNIQGTVDIEDNSLSFDNRFYFSVSTAERIRVLAIGKAKGSYLERVFDSEEFDWKRQELNQLDFGQIPRQNLIVLDELYQISPALQSALVDFYNEGGSIVLIPADNIARNTYNQLLSSLGRIRLKELKRDTLRLDRIQYRHPLYQGVFRQEVADFDNPELRLYYPMTPATEAALLLENEDPFVVSSGRLAVFAAPLQTNFGDFSLSPLIVPTFYNLGKQSIRLPELYVRMGNLQRIDVPYTATQDQVLTLESPELQYIPQQRAYPNRTELVLNEDLDQAGLYTIRTAQEELGQLAINYPVSESKQNWASQANAEQNLTLESLLQQWESENSKAEYWKWAVVMALIFLLLEMGIQKWIK
jgi:hypothetical protein